MGFLPSHGVRGEDYTEVGSKKNSVKNRQFFHYPPDFQKIVKKSAISFIIQVTNRQLGYLKAPEHPHYTR